jgi:DNA repair exonuclease SbcCD ATPase subunit
MNNNIYNEKTNLKYEDNRVLETDLEPVRRNKTFGMKNVEVLRDGNKLTVDNIRICPQCKIFKPFCIPYYYGGSCMKFCKECVLKNSKDKRLEKKLKVDKLLKESIVKQEEQVDINELKTIIKEIKNNEINKQYDSNDSLSDKRNVDIDHEIKTEIEEFKRENEKLDLTVKDLNKTIEDLNETIEGLNEKNEKLDLTVKDLNETVNDLSALLKEEQRKLVMSDEEKDSLRQQLKKYRERT